MIQFFLMLIGLAFGHNNANTSSCNHDTNGQPTAQLTNPGDGTDPGTGGPVGGNSGQTPPPFTNP